MKLATCHPHRKAKARGLCASCYDKVLKSENPIYRAKQFSNTTLWKQKNPEKYKASVERRRAKEALEPEKLYIKRRNTFLKHKYGINQEEYLRLLEKQRGGCAICGRLPKDGKTLHVDHSHESGKVRGLLCHQCNWYLGTIDANPSILDTILEYRKIG